MTVIVDASALVAYLLREEGFEAVRELLSTGVESVDLVVKESCNAILTAERDGRLSRDEADKTVRAVLALANTNVRIFPQTANLILEAFILARENSIAIYDAIYVALAKSSHGTLVSKDGRQTGTAKKLGIKVVNI